MATLKDVLVPDIGDFTDVPIIEVMVGPGDTVAPEDPLVTLESDKATMDVPAPFGGVVQELKVNVGDKVAQGSPLLMIEVSGGNGSAPAQEPSDVKEPGHAGAAETALEAEAEAETEPKEPTTAPEPDASDAPPYASPAVRRLAREKGIDLSTVQGSGRKGRITKEDVEGTASGDGAAPAPSAAPSGERTERVELTRIKKLSGPNLV